jgi:hypothetical protein
MRHDTTQLLLREELLVMSPGRKSWPTGEHNRQHLDLCERRPVNGQ